MRMIGGIGGPRPPGLGAWIARIVLTVLTLSACAQSPETIRPIRVGSARFQDLTCPQLGHELSRLNEQIAVLSTEQRTKRTNDVVGWIFLHYPTDSVGTKDIRPQIALYQGEREVVEGIMAQRCSSLRF